jgi:hypothetical protein
VKKIKKVLDRHRIWRYFLPWLMEPVIWIHRCGAYFCGGFFMVCLGSVSKFWLDEALEVKVSGSWLREFGFEYGGKFVVEVTKGQIVIKPVDIEDMAFIEEAKV